jgi:hypothetical protein
MPLHPHLDGNGRKWTSGFKVDKNLQARHKHEEYGEEAHRR